MTEEQLLDIERQVRSWVKNIDVSVKLERWDIYLYMDLMLPDGRYRSKIDITSHYDKPYFKNYIQSHISYHLRKVYFPSE